MRSSGSVRLRGAHALGHSPRQTEDTAPWVSLQKGLHFEALIWETKGKWQEKQTGRCYLTWCAWRQLAVFGWTAWAHYWPVQGGQRTRWRPKRTAWRRPAPQKGPRICQQDTTHWAQFAKLLNTLFARLTGCYHSPTNHHAAWLDAIIYYAAWISLLTYSLNQQYWSWF